MIGVVNDQCITRVNDLERPGGKGVNILPLLLHVRSISTNLIYKFMYVCEYFHGPCSKHELFTVSVLERPKV